MLGSLIDWTKPKTESESEASTETSKIEKQRKKWGKKQTNSIPQTVGQLKEKEKGVSYTQ